jgi:hypothetical protein
MRAHPVARPHHGTDGLAPGDQGHPAAPRRAGLGMPADQARLGDADGRQVDHHAEMGGDPEPARMGDAVAVDHHEVGRLVQQRQRLEHGRDLAEREIARDVGKAGRLRGEPALQELEAGAVDQHHGGPGEPARLGHVHVDPGDQPRRLGAALGDHLAAQPLLQGARRLDALGPVDRQRHPHAAGDPNAQAP